MTPAVIYRNCGNSSGFNKLHSLRYSKVLPSNIDILKNLPTLMPISSDLKLNNTVIDFLNCFQEIIVLINNNQEISNNLPPLHFSTIDDDAIFIEWIFPYFRIGFSIESQIENSNWFLVTNRQYQEKAGSGLFNPAQPIEILSRLITFALNNS